MSRVLTMAGLTKAHYQQGMLALHNFGKYNEERAIERKMFENEKTSYLAAIESGELLALVITRVVFDYEKRIYTLETLDQHFRDPPEVLELNVGAKGKTSPKKKKALFTSMVEAAAAGGFNAEAWAMTDHLVPTPTNWANQAGVAGQAQAVVGVAQGPNAPLPDGIWNNVPASVVDEATGLTIVDDQP